jgi:hypothetical protein
MTLRATPRHLEAQHGRALIEWADKLVPTIPELRWLFHVPNGLKMGGTGSTEKDRRVAAMRAALAKAEGLRKGVWDYHLPFRSACGHYPSLWIELKSPNEEFSADGGLSDDQREFGNAMRAQGARPAVCFRWDQAAAVVLNHLRTPVPHPSPIAPFTHVDVAAILLSDTPRLLSYQPVRRAAKTITSRSKKDLSAP